MFDWFHKTFILPASAGRLAEQQSNEAKVLALDHRAKAEYHQAMADMLEARVARLELLDPSGWVEPPHAHLIS